MRVVSVKLLRNKLSECVHLAAGGESVLVTVRNRVVAELCPPRPARAAEIADAVPADAVRAGWVTLPLAPDRSPPPRRPVASSRAIAAGFAADRDDR